MALAAASPKLGPLDTLDSRACRLNSPEFVAGLLQEKDEAITREALRRALKLQDAFAQVHANNALVTVYMKHLAFLRAHAFSEFVAMKVMQLLHRVCRALCETSGLVEDAVDAAREALKEGIEKLTSVKTVRTLVRPAAPTPPGSAAAASEAPAEPPTNPNKKPQAGAKGQPPPEPAAEEEPPRPPPEPVVVVRRADRLISMQDGVAVIEHAKAVLFDRARLLRMVAREKGAVSEVVVETLVLAPAAPQPLAAALPIAKFDERERGRLEAVEETARGADADTEALEREEAAGRMEVEHIQHTAAAELEEILADLAKGMANEDFDKVMFSFKYKTNKALGILEDAHRRLDAVEAAMEKK